MILSQTTLMLINFMVVLWINVFEQSSFRKFPQVYNTGMDEVDSPFNEILVIHNEVSMGVFWMRTILLREIGEKTKNYPLCAEIKHPDPFLFSEQLNWNLSQGKQHQPLKFWSKVN